MDGTAPCGDIPMSMFSRRYISRRMPHVTVCLPFFGITKILKVEVMHRVTDYYGPIVYSHFADPEARYMPNTQKEVYSAFFL